jgi:hypothetical protein
MYFGQAFVLASLIAGAFSFEAVTGIASWSVQLSAGACKTKRALTKMSQCLIIDDFRLPRWVGIMMKFVRVVEKISQLRNFHSTHDFILPSQPLMTRINERTQERTWWEVLGVSYTHE